VRASGRRADEGRIMTSCLSREVTNKQHTLVIVTCQLALLVIY
jgi:hypothetical protein